MASTFHERAAMSSEMLAVFDDTAQLDAALRFEAALAAAQADEGLLSPAHARLIAQACDAARQLDTTTLARAAAHAGTLAIPLVEDLRARVAAHDNVAAALVHLGATSQDLADTAMMLQAKTAMALIRRDLRLMTEALAHLADVHAATPLLGRTLLQAARPTTFGLKVAGWLTAVDAAGARLEREAAEAIAVQYGGAVGTLAGLNGKGVAVTRRLADALGLAAPILPWHARREAVAGLAAALAILAGALGKLARDIALMSQTEVGEAFEPRIDGRGGSSAMPHKRNPAGCQVAISAALRTPGLAATILSGLPQEHERGLGGWQAEAPVLADLFLLTHGALAALLPVVLGLEIDGAAMGRNLASADVGDDLGEAAALTARALAHRKEPR